MKGIALCIFLIATAFANPGVDLSLSTDELQRYFGVSSHEKAPEYEIVYPEFLTTDSKRNVGRSAIATSSLELQIGAFGQTLELALEQDGSFIRPGLVAEYISEEGTITVPVRSDCLYTGKVKGESTSLASVSACEGLIAMINHADGPTYIEPLDEEHAIKRDVGRGLPHIAYKRMPDTGASCPVTGADFSVEDDDDDKIDDISTKSTKYLELGVIGDSELYSLRGGNTANCLTALFNAAKNVLQLSSLDASNTMEPKLVTLKVFTSAEAGLVTCPDALKSLQTARIWQHNNNPSSSSLAHWDNAAIITGWELESGSTLGIAYVGSCGSYSSVSVTSLRTLAATDVLAHEIGHNLNMQHDSDGNGCSSSGKVMAAYINDHRAEPSWSTCSKSYYDSFVGSRTCYNDS
ncbi:A disintegrin and metalloproteinase with thrombospondin motifs 18-like [Asterias rubens]|uniref:A disintegrin and metalloproteinase with thrombospondin motifs 18-like n=1 Tax=Asterias rubens TaxID=7604 RepID=UPI00145597FF|nr:A disintegrin and metalloproteinase with thrombospondin motifs 18-like [Asterias rubens]